MAGIAPTRQARWYDSLGHHVLWSIKLLYIKMEELNRHVPYFPYKPL